MTSEDFKTSDSYQTFQEALRDLKSAYESMINTAQYQSTEVCNLILNLAPAVKAIQNALDEIDIEGQWDKGSE